MKYVFLKEGKAHEIIPEYDERFPGVQISERYSAEFCSNLIFVSAGTEIDQGWLYDPKNKIFSAPSTEVIEDEEQ